MDEQQAATNNNGKFREPRGWAVKWCGEGLIDTRRQPKAAKPAAREFRKPRGWAAKWSGNGLLGEGRR